MATRAEDMTERENISRHNQDLKYLVRMSSESPWGLKVDTVFLEILRHDIEDMWSRVSESVVIRAKEQQQQ